MIYTEWVKINGVGRARVRLYDCYAKFKSQINRWGIMDYDLKRLSDYSDESLLNELKRVAKKLDKNTMTYKEFKEYGGKVSDVCLANRFGSWNAALQKAGLSIKRVSGITDEELFVEIERVWNQLGRQPTYKEIQRSGRFATSTYAKRFGAWTKALEEFKRWEEDKRNDLRELKEISPDILLDQQKSYPKRKKVEYGEPIDFLGLRHAPLNEQGVVYLFGMLSKNLGFIIEAIRTDFPDCEGKRQIPGKQGRWERVAIEFEYRSSQFKEHGHNPDECDVIICWEDDWEECPIGVISLKEIMKRIKKQEQ
jgi:hypothetical protein